MKRHILAISGGGFSEEDAYIDDFLLKLCNKTKPKKICFIATASDESPDYIEKFYQRFQTEEPSHLMIADLNVENIQETVNSFDIVYIGGGNTYYMLNVWRETGFDQVMLKAYESGVIICGISAGAICWFEDCYSKRDEAYVEFKGLGILHGSFCPHYNIEARRIAFDYWAEKQKDKPMYKLMDNENLHFINEKLVAKITT